MAVLTAWAGPGGGPCEALIVLLLLVCLLACLLDAM